MRRTSPAVPQTRRRGGGTLQIARRLQPPSWSPPRAEGTAAAPMRRTSAVRSSGTALASLSATSARRRDTAGFRSPGCSEPSATAFAISAAVLKDMSPPHFTSIHPCR
eukprot:TRINITY_DN643_c0_g2_i8.p1 TRINITY_DN643_c0_g2~~TRINITY_DN643_c0_g2_i8.p1  ORF type:complete len:108 (-),score=9.80 TRINITY_DN643_c0_g2_i8:130-453(-)